MQNVKLLLGVIGGTLALVLGVAYLFSGQTPTTEVVAVDPALTIGQARNVKMASSQLESETIEGTEATQAAENQNLITIVEFSDFQCPACKSASGTVKNLLDAYPDQVRLIYRHFPLQTIHPYAMDAALATEAIADEGLFWEYHDLLFENQEKWAESQDHRADFVSLAQELGVQAQVIEAAFDSNEYKNRVNQDIDDGIAANVDSTPTFFIDGVKVGLNDLGSVVASKL